MPAVGGDTRNFFVCLTSVCSMGTCHGSLLLHKKLWILSLTSRAACDVASLTDSALLELDIKPFWNHHIYCLLPWWISIMNFLWQELFPTHHPLPPLGLAKRNPSKSNSNIFCDVLSDQIQVWVRYPSFLFPEPLTLSYSVYFFYH